MQYTNNLSPSPLGGEPAPRSGGFRERQKIGTDTVKYRVTKK